MREDCKKLREMKKDNDNSLANMVMTIEDDDVHLATIEEVAKSEWVMDSTASKHICWCWVMIDSLKTNGEFGQFKFENDDKLKLEGIESVRMKLQDGAIQTFHDVSFVPYVVSNIISLRV